MPTTTSPDDTVVCVTMLFAGPGDSLLIRFCDNGGVARNILIDGGQLKKEYSRSLKPRVGHLFEKNECLDLLVITHDDSDHIRGICWLMEDLERGHFGESAKTKGVSQLWFNCPQARDALLSPRTSESREISYSEAKTLSRFLAESTDITSRSQVALTELTPISFFDATLTILSPTKQSLRAAAVQQRDIAARATDHSISLDMLISENTSRQESLDSSPENGGSIAFLFETTDVRLLFLGDATPPIIDSAIEQLCRNRGQSFLRVDAVKASHHGSEGNLSNRFLSLVHSDRFFFSTNGAHQHPHKRTIAKILAHPNRSEIIHFYFNYRDAAASLGLTAEDEKKYNFKVHKPNTDEQEICFTL